MSTMIERLIFCDDCGENCSGDDRNSGETFKQMRARRKSDGWIQKGSKDYCQVCAKKYENNNKEIQ